MQGRRTVLFVGAGRRQRRAILRARASSPRVMGAPTNLEALERAEEACLLLDVEVEAA